MIHASMTRDSAGRLASYEAKGHAGYAEDGYDIVCAAVSVLGTTCVNSLEALLGIQVVLRKNRDGHLAFDLPGNLTEEKQRGAQLLMGNLRIGLSQIAEEYPENLSFAICNGGKKHDQT